MNSKRDPVGVDGPIANRDGARSAAVANGIGRCRPLHASYVRTLLHRFGDKTGIDKRVHPHALRHSMAFDLMWEGVPVPLIQTQLGHASLATTQRYLDHLAPKDLVDVMQRRTFAV